jgi:2'-5' RNA ligase
MRLFTCIWIPENIREKIKIFQKEVMKLPMKAKFVETENLHITISFLGERKDSEIPSIIRKMNEITEQIKRFEVKIEELKTIPNENYIRVIGIAVKDGNITDLIKSVGEAINGNFYLEQKITLCRIKKIFDKEFVKKFIELNKNVKIGGFPVEKVSLVKSTLTKNGPLYETIHDSCLKYAN